jgi:hypothetical protein
MMNESRSFIEEECLRVTRAQPGCGHLKVTIARTDAPNRTPNWEVLGFVLNCHPQCAIEAIGIVRCQYVLTPYVKPARREAS